MCGVKRLVRNWWWLLLHWALPYTPLIVLVTKHVPWHREEERILLTQCLHFAPGP